MFVLHVDMKVRQALRMPSRKRFTKSSSPLSPVRRDLGALACCALGRRGRIIGSRLHLRVNLYSRNGWRLISTSRYGRKLKITAPNIPSVTMRAYDAGGIDSRA